MKQLAKNSYQEAEIEIISIQSCDLIQTSAWKDDNVDSDGWT